MASREEDAAVSHSSQLQAQEGPEPARARAAGAEVAQADPSAASAAGASASAGKPGALPRDDRNGGAASPGGGPAEGRLGKKRKVALFLAYVGAGYSGMQHNPNAKTIEADLERAIVAAGGISADNAGDFRKVSWNRAARTDRGVSAIGQVVSLRMVLEPPGIIERIQKHLPAQIRVFGCVRTTNGFSARKHCDHRRYQYLIPTWALDRAYRPEPDAPSWWQRYRASGEVLPEHRSLPDDRRAELDALLSQFVGTHNFHNYTVDVAGTDPSAKRHVLSFGVRDVIEVSGVPFVRLEIVGQSFMLHQIRKMVGMVLAIARGVADPSCLRLALEPRRDIFTIPMAPASGLLLAESVFQVYNRNWGKDREVASLERWGAEAEAFAMGHVYPQMVRDDEEHNHMHDFVGRLESKGKEMFGDWASLPVHNRPYDKRKGKGRPRNGKQDAPDAKRRRGRGREVDEGGSGEEEEEDGVSE